MQKIKHDEWYGNEKAVFQQWHKQEIEYWKAVGYDNLEVIPLGIKEKEMCVMWQHEMYRGLFKKAVRYQHLYTYCLEGEHGRNHCVEVGFGDFELFTNITVGVKQFIPEFHFRRQNGIDYLSLDKYNTLKKSERDFFEEHLPAFLAFYEEIKDFVLTKSKDRLRLLTGGFSINEREVEKMKQSINEMAHER